MINKNILTEKYENLVYPDVDKFINELNSIKTSGQLDNLIPKIPLLIYSKNKRNPIYYLIAVQYSLEIDKVLNYTVVTGQTIQREHFADKERDVQLNELIYHNDLLFISLSQTDYTSEYLENLLIDLIEFRKNNRKPTVISYDIVDTTNYFNLTKKLKVHFESNSYQIVSLINDKPFSRPQSTNGNEPKVVKVKPTKTKGRIE